MSSYPPCTSTRSTVRVVYAVRCFVQVSLKHAGPTGRRVGRRVRRNGPSSRPSALRKGWVLPPALPFTTGHLIAGRYFVLRSEDDGPGDGQESTRRKFECLPIAKSLYFYFFYYTISISRQRDREEGIALTADQDTHCRTGTTGQT